MTRWRAFCLDKLHRLPGEVERDNPGLTTAEVWRCFALQNIERRAFSDASKAGGG